MSTTLPCLLNFRSFNVAECNLGGVKLEPMQSAAVGGQPRAGGSHLLGLLQGHLYCVPAAFSFAFACHSLVPLWLPLPPTPFLVFVVQQW